MLLIFHVLFNRQSDGYFFALMQLNKSILKIVLTFLNICGIISITVVQSKSKAVIF